MSMTCAKLWCHTSWPGSLFRQAHNFQILCQSQFALVTMHLPQESLFVSLYPCTTVFMCCLNCIWLRKTVWVWHNIPHIMFWQWASSLQFFSATLELSYRLKPFCFLQSSRETNTRGEIQRKTFMSKFYPVFPLMGTSSSERPTYIIHIIHYMT